MTGRPGVGDPAEAPSARIARAVVEGLVAKGVRDVVLAPGSRSAPLAYALLAAERAGRLRLHVRVDERSAAFLALGLILGSAPGADDGARSAGPVPVAVVTTSGTAAANLHPAVLEAAHSGRPLVVITADRPADLRGTGANQTTHQPGLFGRAVRWEADLPAGEPAAGTVEAVLARAVAAARGAFTADPGPVHLNVGLREPLVPRSTWSPGAGGGPRVAPLAPRRGVVGAGSPDAAGLPLAVGPNTLVVAGDGAGPGARALAERGRWPLLAEPTSGARAGACALGPYRHLLEVPELADGVERVVVLGRPTLSRPVSRLLARRDVEIVVVAARPEWVDVAGAASVVAGAVVVGEETGPGGTGRTEDWLERWRVADAAAREALAAHLAGELTGPAVARIVGEAVRGGAGGARALFVGSSNPVRDLDLADVPPAGEPALVVANRGLAGIDGSVSTAAGLALALDAPVRALLGDLTFQHDVGGLAAGALEREPDLQVVVLNDDGGGIFALLEHGEPGRVAEYERLFGTPQRLDLGALARGFGARHVAVADAAALREALAWPVRGRSVLEVRVRRAGRRAWHEAVRADVVAAVRRALG